MVMESMFQLSSGYMARLSLVRFHKLGALLPWEFFKCYTAEGDTICINRMAVSKVYGYHGYIEVKGLWLNNLYSGS